MRQRQWRSWKAPCRSWATIGQQKRPIRNSPLRVYGDLQNKNVRCWYSPEDLKIGDRFQERIEESIRLHDKLLIVLSEASVSSAWVEREVHAAREREDRS